MIELYDKDLYLFYLPLMLLHMHASREVYLALDFS